MHRPKYLLYCHFLVPLLLICSSSLAEVDLHQTIPPDGLACPNDTLQFTCTAPGNDLLLEVGSLHSEEFTNSDSVNASLTFGDYVAVLVVQNETMISATITKDRVMSSDSGTLITCTGDSSFNDSTITIADGPANCSSMSVVPACQITTNAENSSDDQVWITLSTNGSLMCVMRYLIQFNGENRTVPVSSASAEFPIPVTQGEPLDLEIVVYTLDYENRTGKMPCIFSTANISCFTSSYSSPSTSSTSTTSSTSNLPHSPANIGCSISSCSSLRTPSSYTPSPTSSSDTFPGVTSGIIAVIVIAVLVVLLLLLLVVIVITICRFYFKNSCKHKNAPQESLSDSAVQLQEIQDLTSGQPPLSPPQQEPIQCTAEGDGSFQPRSPPSDQSPLIPPQQGGGDGSFQPRSPPSDQSPLIPPQQEPIQCTGEGDGTFQPTGPPSDQPPLTCPQQGEEDGSSQPTGPSSDQPPLIPPQQDEADLGSTEDSKAHYEGVISRKDEELRKTRLEKEKLEEELKKKKTEIADLKKKIESKDPLGNEVLKLRRELDLEKEKREELEKKIKEKDETINELKEEIANLGEHMKKMEENIGNQLRRHTDILNQLLGQTKMRQLQSGEVNGEMNQGQMNANEREKKDNECNTNEQEKKDNKYTVLHESVGKQRRKKM